MSRWIKTALLRSMFPDRPGNGTIAGLLAVMSIGAFLRLYQLGRQIVAGDEWHAIHAALFSSYSRIFSDFGGGGHSIPMAIYNKILIDTIGLSELTLYAPFVFFGIIAILILPLLVHKFVGGINAVLFAILLSLSPLLIFYSRFSRPYGLVALFGFLAVYFFYLWMNEGHLRILFLLYVLFATLTVYLHVVAFPFVFGALVYYSFVELYKKKDERLKTACSIIKVFAIALVPALMLLALPVINSFSAISDKANQTGVSLKTLIGSFLILIGGKNVVFIFISAALLCIGIGWNLRRPDNRKFTVYLVFLSLVQAGAIIVSRPLAVGAAHIFSRYIITIEPILLFFVSTGIGWTIGRLKKAIPLALAAVICFYSYYCIPAELFRYNNSTQMYLLGQLMFGKNFEKLIFQKVIKSRPSFYSGLNAYPPGSISLVEAPYHPDGHYIYAYQLLHHQKVAMGFVGGLCSGNRWGEVPFPTANVAFANFVYLADLHQLSAKKVDFVVFHKNLHNEVTVAPEHRHLDLSKCIEQYHMWFGQPYYEDDIITVFSTRSKGLG